jgi:predicted nucleotide-binding protein
MDSTTAFLKALAPLDLSNGERAVALIWWHTRSDGAPGRAPAQVARDIEAAGYPAQHVSRIREALTKDRRIIKSRDTFKVRIDARPKLDETYSKLVQDIQEEPETYKERSKKIVSALPRVFIGSSAEGLDVAEALQEGLDHCAEMTVWSQGVFGLSSGTLETLAEKSNGFDFAILVLTPDDLTQKRGSSQPSARDNVLLELGIFIGVLGRKRTFIVYPRDVEMHLPSDLAGVTPATFAASRSDDNIAAAVGAVCTKIKRELAQQGLREGRV